MKIKSFAMLAASLTMGFTQTIYAQPNENLARADADEFNSTRREHYFFVGPSLRSMRAKNTDMVLLGGQVGIMRGRGAFTLEAHKAVIENNGRPDVSALNEYSTAGVVFGIEGMSENYTILDFSLYGGITTFTARDAGGVNSSKDMGYILEPRLNLALETFDIVRLGAGVGYNWMFGVDNPYISTGDFGAWSFGISAIFIL